MAVFVLLAFVAQFAQVDVGELRVIALDPTGGVLPGATVTIDSDASQTHRSLVTDAAGTAAATRLPFGAYRVDVALQGFTTDSQLVTIRSSVPTQHHVTLALAPLAIVDTVSSLPLVDERQTTTVQRLGAETLQRRPAALPGRALPELINTQPGWLLEAGGSVHPRGSENQTQYVVDGLPLTDNRSPGFAPELDADAVHALGILTGGYPAEYGRKLGGVIEVTTTGDPQRGFHGGIAIGGGSFGTLAGEATAGYSGGAGYLAASLSASRTGRYLDPPVEENYTNTGETGRAGVHAERGRFGVQVSHAANRFMVPNEAAQQDAGQIQRRTGGETAGRISYQDVRSSSVVSVSGMLRTLDAALTSNAAATPIFAEQQRGLTDGYVKATIAWHRGSHELKAGGDTSVGRLHERFAYVITNPEAFDPGTLPSFAFSGRATGREHALFVQDQVAAGPWTVKAGVRWDAYHLLVNEYAVSPRLAAAWSPLQGFTVRGSYDRAFQTPAIENLLLASSPEVESLAPAVVRLPVRPSRGNFFELAMSKSIAGLARLDASWYDRRMSNFADDDLLLNTGVSFPIAFQRGLVHGAELKLDVPSGRRVSGFVSYSWMRGEAELPATGGLFLGDEVDLGTPGDRVTITQDQRHTLRGRLAVKLHPNSWAAVSAAFDSGLPVENPGDPAALAGEFPTAVLDRVNFDTGRVRPSSTLNASAGWVLAKKKGGREVSLQADVRNITDALRVINFAGVFSGTALAAPRSFAARLRVDF